MTWAWVPNSGITVAQVCELLARPCRRMTTGPPLSAPVSR